MLSSSLHASPSPEAESSGLCSRLLCLSLMPGCNFLSIIKLLSVFLLSPPLPLWQPASCSTAPNQSLCDLAPAATCVRGLTRDVSVCVCVCARVCVSACVCARCVCDLVPCFEPYSNVAVDHTYRMPGREEGGEDTEMEKQRMK